MEKMKSETIVLRGGDNWNVEVPLDLGLKIPSIRDKLNQDIIAGKLKKTYKLRGITRDAFGWVLDYLNDDDMGHQSTRLTDWPHLLAQLPLVSLFNIIQAAYFLNIESLMDLSCRTMATKLKELKITSTLSDIYKLFNIHNTGCLSVKTAKRDVYTSPCSRDSDFKSIIRNRTKGAFINDLNILGMQFSFPLSKELGPIDTYSKRWKSPFYECVEEISESMNFRQWVKAIHKLEGLVKQDFRLATCLSGKITRGLLQILEGSKYYGDLRNDVQRPIISIISHARFTTCNDVVENHVVPALVKIASDGNIEVSDTAMLALTRLAYAFPNHYKVFVNKGALDAAQRVFRDFCDARDTNMSSLAMFLAAVCRGYSVAHTSDDLPSDKVEKILPILEDLLRQNEHCYDKTRIFACYALSYLTYGMFAPLSTETFSNLFAIFANDNFSLSLAGPALGVVGNVVRWGNLDQIKFLLGYGLLESLEQVLCLKYKKFLKEACQIISNVAARHGTLIKKLIAADLIEHLCYFLEHKVSDVKLEAAWAIFYSIRGLAENGEIDQYPETVVNRYILREREREREREGDDNGSAGR